MDNGVKFAIKNAEKALNLIGNNDDYKNLSGKVLKEYHYLKSFKNTGNLYQHFLKYKNDDHKYANDFKFLENYDIITNEKMADYLEKNFKNELNNLFTINEMQIGKIYSNNEIRKVFQCSDMGGMRRSKKTNSLVLIAKHNNPLYDDSWTQDGILNYTGMGTSGNQSINFGQNKTLALANKNGINLYLFESYIDNEYYYRGEVFVDGPIFSAQEYDEKGLLREVLKFPLRRKNNDPILLTSNEITVNEKVKAKNIKKLSNNDIKKKAKTIITEPGIKEVITTYRDRNQIVSEYTKNRANGICDLCGKPAPFIDKNDKPYLEEHHVITLSEGGPDQIYNTVAICPNCHRKIHVLSNKKDVLKLQQVILKYLIDDKDKENIKKYNDLFKDGSI